MSDKPNPNPNNPQQTGDNMDHYMIFSMEAIREMAFMLWTEENSKFEIQDFDIVHVEHKFTDDPPVKTVVIRNASEEWIKVVNYLNDKSSAKRKRRNAYGIMCEHWFPVVSRPSWYIRTCGLPEDVELSEAAKEIAAIHIADEDPLEDHMGAYFDSMVDMYEGAEWLHVQELLDSLHEYYYGESALKRFLQCIDTHNAIKNGTYQFSHHFQF